MVLIDFKINNAHNNTDPLLIFFFTCCEPLSLLVFCQLGCRLDFSSSHTQKKVVSLNFFGRVLLQNRPALKEIPPQSPGGRMCIVAAAAASWLVQAPRSPSIPTPPACTQWSVRQRGRGNGGINDYL